MTCVFATYHHSAIGFPGVVLKWHEEDGKILPCYVTIRQIITPNWFSWQYGHAPTNPVDLSKELSRFDEQVRRQYADDASVQG